MAESPYRDAEEKYENDPDALYDYLREHRLDDPSLTLGYWLKHADRVLGLNQSDVTRRTAVVKDGDVVVPELSRGFLSAVLSRRTRATPDTYTRIASAVGANPLEFFIAEGWIDPSDIVAYSLPHASDWQPIAKKLDAVPAADRRKVVALVGSIIDAALTERNST